MYSWVKIVVLRTTIVHTDVDDCMSELKGLPIGCPRAALCTLVIILMESARVTAIDAVH